jgi:hypothetical protein
LGEYDIWKTATQVLAVVAITVGVIQRTQYMFLDVLFEVCIFHVPAITSLLIYSRQSQS